MRHASLLMFLLILTTLLSFSHAQVESQSGNSTGEWLTQARERSSQLDVSNRFRKADYLVCLKALEWLERHDEYLDKNFEKYAQQVKALAEQRLASLEAKQNTLLTPGSHALGYQSQLDDSYQPYLLTVPRGFDKEGYKRWPLHVVLHGRNKKLTEVSFIAKGHGQPAPEEQTWIQLDVYGRGNNAYRWAGEVDVFEAMADVKRRLRIDENRITLWGFSMGGAGAWHLGLHHPDQWSSAGAGAGFVDFYKYQRKTEKLPSHQHKTLRIYDSLDYALNLANVPFVGYGGDMDKQLASGKMMLEKAEALDVPLKLIIGKNIGHKFTPEAKAEFMAFHAEHTTKGKPRYPGPSNMRFITYTPKYNQCRWLTIEELETMYEPAIVESEVDPITGALTLTTINVRSLRISRDIASQVQIDDSNLMPLASAAGSLLPDVYFEVDGGEWVQLDYDESRLFMENPELRKRHDLQGPIDDAFMGPFVCVQGNGAAWSEEHQQWSDFTFNRAAREYDKWLRADLPKLMPEEVTSEVIRDKNLILFGDPGSNPLIAKVVDRLPITWTKEAITVNGETYSTKNHGVSLIYPNPLNFDRYVVINSGYTMHEQDFKASNSYLFPKLGDIAVIKFSGESSGERLKEEVVWAGIFDGDWELGE